MSHPLTWPSVPKFYPMGWIPAASLTQDLSPEQPADVLVLGCGDPRHILYTISTDVTAPLVPRKLDVTCCDIEPAVLARNIILYTLLEDGISSTTVWDIFYHFELSAHVTGVLTSHACELVKLSETCKTWRESKYGGFIKLVDANSLFELRRFWSFYAEFPNLSSIRLDKLKKEQTKVAATLLEKLIEVTNVGVSRSATVVWEDASESVSNEVKHY
ncbi:hypothetical protein FRC09_000611 [Ceratobasidium sp. 395]|nr:hypothetical protein FRC09_000611 [Ceratobasidium sp. 395]